MGIWKRGLTIVVLSVLSLLLVGTGDCPKKTTPGNGGNGDVPGHVMNLELASWGDGTSVHVFWDEPTLGSPIIVGYRVYFRPANATFLDEFSIIADNVIVEYYIHETYDHESHIYMTGDYYVVAFNDEGEGQSVDTASTIPARASSSGMWELDAPSVYRCYGFNREDGQLDEFSSHAENADWADLYLSDLMSPGYIGPHYYFVSVHYNDSIPADSARFPEAPWRVTGIYNSGAEWPTYASPGISYASIVLCQEDNCYIVQTEDGYYASIKVPAIYYDEGSIDGDARFQLVRGLRLLYRNE
jgi:hypothetical protein